LAKLPRYQENSTETNSQTEAANTLPTLSQRHFARRRLGP
jgi:hypothetical protein